MNIIKNLVPESKYGIKCPYTMKPTRIVVHNTANDATARNEIAYMTNNNYETSFHYAVDDKEVVQGIPENRNGWHASDGNGKGNREGIAIEICYSKSGGDRFIKAEQNAVELIVDILKRYGWGVDRVTKHQDYTNKYCPHRTLDMGWERFIKMIEDKLNPVKPTPIEPTPTTSRKVGDVVTINGVYVSSTSTEKLKPLVTKGTITKIVDARNPYLLDNGNIGWVNNDCITSGNASKKSIDEVAREVIQGKYGNQPERQKRLEAEGYNYREVQNRVNQLLR
jgi:N-acetylmuramoyl-L-alanine amidase CwlA